MFLISNQSFREVSGHWHHPQTCVCRILEKWCVICRMLIPAVSSRAAELWGIFALFSTATTLSAWGVSLSTSFGWVKYYFIYFLVSAICYCCSHLLYIYPGHTRCQLISYPRTRQNRYPASDGISFSAHQCQRLSTNMSARAKHYFLLPLFNAFNVWQRPSFPLVTGSVPEHFARVSRSLISTEDESKRHGQWKSPLGLIR